MTEPTLMIVFIAALVTALATGLGAFGLTGVAVHVRPALWRNGQVALARSDWMMAAKRDLGDGEGLDSPGPLAAWAVIVLGVSRRLCWSKRLDRRKRKVELDVRLTAPRMRPRLPDDYGVVPIDRLAYLPAGSGLACGATWTLFCGRNGRPWAILSHWPLPQLHNVPKGLRNCAGHCVRARRICGQGGLVGALSIVFARNRACNSGHCSIREVSFESRVLSRLSGLVAGGLCWWMEWAFRTAADKRKSTAIFLA